MPNIIRKDKCAPQRELEKLQLPVMDSVIYGCTHKCSNPTFSEENYLRSKTKVVICRQRRKLWLWLLRLAFKRNNKWVAIAQVKENQLWSSVFVCSVLIKTCGHNHFSPPGASDFHSCQLSLWLAQVHFLLIIISKSLSYFKKCCWHRHKLYC